MELRRLRLELGLSQKDVAEELDWSASKLLRIENGEVNVSTTDLRALLGHYGVDPIRVDELTGMARTARMAYVATRRQASLEHGNAVSSRFIRFMEYERAARVVRNYESQYVPGLLQTPEYAMEVFRQRPSAVPDEQLEWGVALRIERQRLIGRPDAPEMFFIIDEPVIRRWIGGAAVMRRQLKHLKLMEQHPKVTIQVIEFTSGKVPGVASGFLHLQFSNPFDHDLAYFEDAQGDMFIHDDETRVSAYLNTFLELAEIATLPERFGDVIDDAIDAIPDGVTSV